MPPESWLVLIVAAAFLLLGVAGLPLAWVLFHHRRSRSEQLMEIRWRKLASEVRALDDRITQHEAISQADSRMRILNRPDSPGGRGAVRAEETFGRAQGCVMRPAARTAGETSPRTEEEVMRPAPSADSGGRGSVRADSTHEPALIAVPSLEGAPHDREGTVTGIKERYAAIWALADNGATPEMIARATGQPIGQIELILGLRRQIDGARTVVSHARHA